MTPSDLLSALRSLGVELTIAGDKLHYHAPLGVMNPEMRAMLAEHKSEILQTLSPLHLWNSSLPQLERRREDLLQALERGQSVLDRAARHFGQNSSEYNRLAGRRERMLVAYLHLEAVLSVRRFAVAQGAGTPQPEYVPCWICKKDRFWVQPACGEWRCAVCCPPLPDAPVIDFPFVLHRPIRVRESRPEQVEIRRSHDHQISQSTVTLKD